MAAGLLAAITTPKPFRLFLSSHQTPKPIPIFHPLLTARHGARRKTSFAVCFVLEEQKQSDPQIVNLVEKGPEEDVRDRPILIPARVAEKLARKRSERLTYLVAAVMSSFGITSMAAMAVYYRFSWQMEVCFLSFFHPFLFYLFCSMRNILKLGNFFLFQGRRGASFRNVWYICSISWCRCKFNFVHQIIFPNM